MFFFYISNEKEDMETIMLTRLVGKINTKINMRIIYWQPSSIQSGFVKCYNFFLFHSLSSVSGMSCGGTLGTCTHGTGKDYGLIANFVSLQQPQKKKKERRLTEHLVKCEGVILL